MERLVTLRRHRFARELLYLYGIDIHRRVQIGSGLRLAHRGMGTVVHPLVRIGERVTIYHQVTIGRGDGHLRLHEPRMELIDVQDDVVLFPGAKVLGGPGVTTVGRGTVVAANAVLTRSTGEWEIWAGMPARKVGDRPRTDETSATSEAQRIVDDVIRRRAGLLERLAG